MRLALTGGTGFVGSHLIDTALAAGHQVAALTRREQPEREGLDWISGNLDDRAALHRLVDDADAVIHVAGVIAARDKAGFDKGNVEGTLAMLAEHHTTIPFERAVTHTFALAEAEQAMQTALAADTAMKVVITPN